MTVQASDPNRRWPWSKAKAVETRDPTGSNRPISRRMKEAAKRITESTGQVIRDLFGAGDIPLAHPINFDRYATLSMDPEVDTAIMMRTGMEVGVGFQTEDASDQPKEALPTKKKRIDKWNEDNNLDGLLRVIDETRYRYGFCPLQLQPLMALQPEYFWIHEDKYMNVTRYSQRRDRTSSEVTSWQPKEIALFTRRWSPSKPYGISIVEPIVRQLDTRNEVNEELPDVIANIAYPFRVFIARTEAIQKKVEDLVASREKYENVFLGNLNMNSQDPDLTIHEVATDPRFNPTPMLEHMDFEINEGLMSPHLGQLKNATEASANMLMTSIMLDVQSEQRYLKRVVEGELWKSLVGEPPPRMVFNSPAPLLKELTILELSNLLTNMVPRVIDVPEARAIIRAYMRLGDAKYPEKPPEAQVQPVATPFTNPFTQPLMPTANGSQGLEIVLSTLQKAYEEKQIDARMALGEGRKAIEAHIEEAKLNARKTLKREALSPETEAEYKVMSNELFDQYRERLIPMFQKIPRARAYSVKVE